MADRPKMSIVSNVLSGWIAIVSISGAAGVAFGSFVSGSDQRGSSLGSLVATTRDNASARDTHYNSAPDRTVNDIAKSPKSAAPPINPGMNLFELAPITTNLMGDRAPWVRFEGQLVYMATAEAEIRVLAGTIASDILIYLRSLRHTDVSRPGGVQGLIEDLNERARQRSGGKVTQILINSFVLE